MGCTATKIAERQKSKSFVSNGVGAKQRALDYKEQSEKYLEELLKRPNTLLPENYRDGYISVSQFYNLFHGGLCGPYIHNPEYMLIVDFRTREEYFSSHIVTSIHYEEIEWENSKLIDHIKRYSQIVFYDHDGTLAANILSSLKHTFDLLISDRVEVSCILGGINLVQRRFPHLVTSKKRIHWENNKSMAIDDDNPFTNTSQVLNGNTNISGKNEVSKTSLNNGFNQSSESSTSRSGSSSSTIAAGRSGLCSAQLEANGTTNIRHNKIHVHNDYGFEENIQSRASKEYARQTTDVTTIPWMPTLVHRNGIFLGRAEQAEDSRVYRELGLTHVLSIGRSPELFVRDIEYLGLDGEKNLYFTFLKATEFIQSAVEKHGKVLVHGIEGLNRSAAVVIAYLMSSATCILEEAQFYLQVLRPHLQMDDNCYDSLIRWEKSLFGVQLTDLEELWFY